VTTSQPEGYLALFDPDGNQVEASRDDLLSVEGMSFDEPLHRRLAGDRSGRYWLISDRPGFRAMLLEVSIFRCYPREPGNDNWSISYGTNGVASYPGWTLDGALQMFRRRGFGPDPWDGAPIPENVAALARQHVTFRAGRTPGPDPLDRHGIRTRDAAEIRPRLAEFLETRADPDELLRQVAGKRVPVFELMLAVTMFCGEHGLDGYEGELLLLLIPEEQHGRLADLTAELSGQLGAE
jgi:hypothetical protein